MSQNHPNKRRHGAMSRQLRKAAGPLISKLNNSRLATLKAQLTTRTSAFMIAAMVPAILCALVLTVPGFLFCTPEHQALFYFGEDLSSDPVSLLPMGVAAACVAVAILMPALPSRQVFQRVR